MSSRKSSPSVHLLKTNLMSKAEASVFSRVSRASFGEALGGQRSWLIAGRLAQRAVTDRVGLDLGDLAARDSRAPQRFRHGAVDDLEITAARELLELHQREVRLDAGGVAIHDEADRAGRRDHGGLRVAVAVLLALGEGAVPGAFACSHQGLRWSLDSRCVIDAAPARRTALVAHRLAMGGAAMVADDAQHVRSHCCLVAREGAELLRHFGRGLVGDAGHDGGEAAGDGAAGSRNRRAGPSVISRPPMLA